MEYKRTATIPLADTASVYDIELEDVDITETQRGECYVQLLHLPDKREPSTESGTIQSYDEVHEIALREPTQIAEISGTPQPARAVVGTRTPGINTVLTQFESHVVSVRSLHNSRDDVGEPLDSFEASVLTVVPTAFEHGVGTQCSDGRFVDVHGWTGDMTRRVVIARFLALPTVSQTRKPNHVG